MIVCAAVALSSFGPANASVQVCIARTCVDVETARTKQEMERGLQGRQGLGPGKGMLFVFAADGRYRFWMKAMKFPIDILWLDSKGGIVAVGEDLPPCAADPCPVYMPPADVRYVLEVSSGSSRAHGWKPGNHAVIKGIK